VIDFEAKVRELEVRVNQKPGGRLLRASQYTFAYDQAAEAPISQIMPLEDRAFVDGELFAVMDMNLPEGFLLAAIRDRSPKAPPTKMHLLALIGRNGIGWLEYERPGHRPARRAPGVDRKRLLKDGVGRKKKLFRELVDAYLSTGAGLSGVQPKILVPERSTVPVPNLLVKVAADDYPGLAANEHLCLEVARRAGLSVAKHALSDDGELLVIDRFDLRADGQRLGFEDIAALLDLRVGGALSNRKYKGSYEDVAAVIAQFSSQLEDDLSSLFRAVVLAVLLRNGDAHLKNFALLYDQTRCWLAPLFDQVTTTLYAYERADGQRVTDRTMALKLRRGETRRGYPLPAELLSFGRDVCRVARPREAIEPLFDAMRDTLKAARTDERVGAVLLEGLEREWEDALRPWRSS
jgi:serine/threonine-protein kinase HipA